MERLPRLLPLVLFFLSSFLLFGCNEHRDVSRAYYFWRTSDMSYTERAFVKETAISKLYVRCLDVDWNEVHGAVPVGRGPAAGTEYTLRRYDSVKVEVVPVVFITNKTFEKIDTADIALLAQRIVRKSFPAFNAESNDAYPWQDDYELKPTEVQFDCDWTTGTAASYFSFLRSIRKLLPDSVKLSATVRLHQYKYPEKTGVPPVDRGMLMIYHTGSVTDYNTPNSIFNRETAAAYFTGDKKYGLPLDMALPAWSWCLVFRNRQFLVIDNGLGEDEIKGLSFVKAHGPHRYQVLQDTFYRDQYLRRGDELKMETVDETALLQAAALARKAVNTGKYSVALFELSDKEIKNYSRETLDKVYHTVR